MDMGLRIIVPMLMYAVFEFPAAARAKFDEQRSGAEALCIKSSGVAAPHEVMSRNVEMLRHLGGTWTKEQLAKTAGIHRTTLHRLLTGKCATSEAYVAAVAGALGRKHNREITAYDLCDPSLTAEDVLRRPTTAKALRAHSSN
jgi:DNA-binding XRE family transcriptional regulator